MTDDELEYLKDTWKLIAIRELPDGSVAGVQRLMTTFSLMLGIEAEYWTYRYCYEHVTHALLALRTVTGEKDVPNGWVACRPEVRVRDEGGLPRYPTPEELRELRAGVLRPKLKVVV